MSITKHFAEVLYSFDNEGNIQTKTIEVPDRDPILFETDEFTCGFRFFDVAETTIDGEVLRGEKKNYSPTYYLGIRTTLKELSKITMSYPAWRTSEKIGFNYAGEIISCDNGTIITDVKPGDLTMEEYLALDEQEEKKMNTKIERKNLFIGLTDILNTFETETFACREENEEQKYDFITRWSVLTNKKYSIISEDETILSNEMYSNYVGGFWEQTRFNQKDIDKYIKYSDIKEDLDRLVEKYPYLQYFIDNIITICQQKRGHLPLEEIVELEKEYSMVKERKELAKIFK